MIEMHDRKKVIELLKRSEVFFGDLTYDGIKISTKDVAKLIEDQPEIVLCQDCKHGEPCNDGEYYCEKDIGTFESPVHCPEWFCADGVAKGGDT